MAQDANMIKTLRMMRGWSQFELANRAGLTEGLIGRFEDEGWIPGSEGAERLAKAFGVSVEYLTGKPVDPEWGAPRSQPREFPKYWQETAAKGFCEWMKLMAETGCPTPETIERVDTAVKQGTARDRETSPGNSVPKNNRIPTPAYIIRSPSGEVVAAITDAKEHLNVTAMIVGEFVRIGYAVERKL